MDAATDVVCVHAQATCRSASSSTISHDSLAFSVDRLVRDDGISSGLIHVHQALNGA